MKAGDAVLVVLAAANRDPAANAHPERFDPRRRERLAFTFGLGVHACPGEALATIVTEAGVERLLASGRRARAPGRAVSYRPSVNTRISALRVKLDASAAPGESFLAWRRVGSRCRSRATGDGGC